jgi:hypothetical protein
MSNSDYYVALKEFCKEILYPEDEIDKLIHPLIKLKVYLDHAKMQILCADYLRKKGYKVELEKEIGEGLRCDLFAEKDGETLIVEIEANKSEKNDKRDKIRKISKIVRYSKYASKFILGIPYEKKLKLPKEFLEQLFQPPSKRDEEQLKKIKEEVDSMYTKPKIPLEEFKSSKLDLVYLINIEKREIKEKDLISLYKDLYKEHILDI